MAEEDEAVALPELSEDREVAEEDEAVALPELSEDREAAEADAAARCMEDLTAVTAAIDGKCAVLETQAATCTTPDGSQNRASAAKNFHFNNWQCTETKTFTVPALGHDHERLQIVAGGLPAPPPEKSTRSASADGCNHKSSRGGLCRSPSCPGP